MLIYLAGNFPQLSSPKEEKKMVDEIQEQGKEYKRLVSFFYRRETETVLNLKSESLGLAREVTEKKEEIVIPKRQFVNLDLNWPAEW